MPCSAIRSLSFGIRGTAQDRTVDALGCMSCYPSVHVGMLCGLDDYLGFVQVLGRLSTGILAAQLATVASNEHTALGLCGASCCIVDV